MNDNTDKKETFEKGFSLFWNVPISKEEKELLTNYFKSIDYSKFNKFEFEIYGAEDMTLNEATELFGLCKKDDIYCTLSIIVENKKEVGSRMLKVQYGFEENVEKITSMKLIKEDKVIEL